MLKNSYTLSEPKPVTYKELDAITTALTAGFVHLGFTDPQTPVASRPRVSIYADTSLHWQLIAQACGRLGHTFTTAYTTLGEEGLLHSLVEPDVELIYCGEGQVELVAKVVERAAKVRYVIYDGEARVDKVSSLRYHVEGWLSNPEPGRTDIKGTREPWRQDYHLHRTRTAGKVATSLGGRTWTPAHGG